MIVPVERGTLPTIKNPAFRSYAEMYVKIYNDFMKQVAQMGVEIDPQDHTQEAGNKIERLRQMGAVVRNKGKSVYINNISPSCLACRKGVGSATYFISLKCHRDCFYCFNPNQEGYEFFTTNEVNLTRELEYIATNGKKVEHLALTGGEPLLHKDKTVAFFQHAHQKFPSAYTRLYTAGDHLDAQILQDLKDAGLQEIRISIRMHDLEKGRRHTFDRLGLSKEYLPYVMVEMPVLPDTFDAMKEVLLDLERIGIFSINLLEFCFPLNNAEAFRQCGYKIKNPPYQVLYNYWYAGGLPVAQSELVCLDLMEFAMDEGLSIGVHYCSLENKHTGQIYQQNHNQCIPSTSFFSKKDYFLKSAKVFGKDIPKVKRLFRKIGYGGYVTNEDHNYLEFHVSKIKLLEGLNLPVGISTSVIEKRGDQNYIRELKVDLTTPQNFNLAADV